MLTGSSDEFEAEVLVAVAFDFDSFVVLVAFACLFFLSYFVNLAYFAYNIGCLDNMDEAIFVMTEDRCVSYGTLFDILTIGEDEDKTFYENGHIWFGKHKYFYMGTFFWLNAFALVSYMKKVRKIFPNSHAGKDGKSVDLMFED